MAVFAHSLPGRPEHGWEPLSHHLTRVGERTAAFAAAFDAAPVARAAGILHDIGKCAAAYQRYIRTPGANRGPDHSTAGARVAVAEYGAIGRLMGFAIAGHHSGLMDGSGHEGRGSSLQHRLSDAYSIEAHDGWRAHAPALPTSDELLAARRARNVDHPGFEHAFFARMIFSCLVDADFLETERFYAEAEGTPLPQRGGMLTPAHRDRIRADRDRRRREASDTPLNRLRAEILDHAVEKAALPPGLFTLTVPTGGGKTLTSLSFALEHALAHGLRRIVYVIPFTSIIEQTAEVFREALASDADILEYHASFDWDRTPPGGENDSEDEGAAGRAKLRRDAENWDAPIIVTTGVQFWESLFGRRTSRARKLHNLARSVIVLDEAQTLPVHLLRPCMAVLDELARNYGASVVLCTATQPALRKLDGALPPRTKGGAAEGLDISAERELAPRPEALYNELKRVDVVWRREPVEDAEIAARFAAQDRMLCIVNTRRHARELFEAIREQPGARHLTTLMCAPHRREVLAEVRAELAAARPVRLVATSLVEAGVDVDFPEVWRAAAGLDAIAQAAGRCNREGRLEGRGRTIVFEPAAVEGRKSVSDAMVPFYQAARWVLSNGIDPLSLEGIHAYFRELYFEKTYEGLDQPKLGDVVFPILPAIVAGFAPRSRENPFSFPFSRIADAFRLIDEAMEPVLIPWDAAAKDALAALEHADVPPGGALRKLQQYVVPVPAEVRRTMLTAGAARAIKCKAYGDRFICLPDLAQYDQAVGLRLEDATWRSAESNIMS